MCTSRRRRAGNDAALELAAGDRVSVANGVLRGQVGTLERPARVVLDEGWMVRFDGRPLGFRRLRIATWALAPLRTPADR